MLVASTYIAVDPTQPWDLPMVGLPLLAVVALVLIGLTVWTYRGLANVSRGRLLTILGLRLAALVVACALVLRPSLAHQDDEAALPSRLLILVDSSDSMNIADEFANQSRWQRAREILTAPKVAAALRDLAQHNKIEIAYYQGAEGIGRFDIQGSAAGKRTDFGTWLHDLWQLHGREGNLRGLLIFSDGADNGTRFETPLQQATQWKGVCPISTFALGKQSTSLKQRDIALTHIFPPAQPVPVKTQFTVAGRIDAWGFEGSWVDVSLLIEDAAGKLKQIGRKESILLKRREGNEFSLTGDAPNQSGEYKVTLKVEKFPDEVTDLNNQISSFITVSKEGVSILWVEGRQRLETTFILRHALSKDRRFRVYPAFKLGDTGDTGRSNADWFNFEQQHYDVIVIGDISARQFSGGQKKVFATIHDLVEKEGVGLMLFGGHDALGNSDWNTPPPPDLAPLASDLTEMLPVILDRKGQVTDQVRVMPTDAGLSHFVCKLADDPEKNKEIWTTVFKPLDGMSRIGTPRPTATILATDGKSGEPVLVGSTFGNGRMLVFGGDTTWKAWRRSPQAITAFERFWRQAMLWLAHQEKAEGAAWVKLKTRRVAAGEPLSINVGLRGKSGLEAKDAKFKVKVIGPGKKEVPVTVQPGDAESGQVGSFKLTDEPGEYRVEVGAHGTETIDGKITPLKGTTSARFLVVTDDVENQRPAADHDFLEKLARAGGGSKYLAQEDTLLQYLAELKSQKMYQPHVELWPDWRRNPPATLPGQSPTLPDQLGTLWHSAALACLILFVTFLSLEWFLRRRWGLV